MNLTCNTNEKVYPHLLEKPLFCMYIRYHMREILFYHSCHLTFNLPFTHLKFTNCIYTRIEGMKKSIIPLP